MHPLNKLTLSHTLLFRKLQQTCLQSAGRERRAVANGVQKILSKTSMLVNFLPTGTLLTFEIVLPTVYGNGKCSPVSTLMINGLLALCTIVSTLMINVLLALCALSCFFFHFTDSFCGPEGRVHYGFVTPKELAVFNPPGHVVEVPKDERCKVSFTDFARALMSVMVFVDCFLFSPTLDTGIGCMVA